MASGRANPKRFKQSTSFPSGGKRRNAFGNGFSTVSSVLNDASDLCRHRHTVRAAQFNSVLLWAKLHRNSINCGIWSGVEHEPKGYIIESSSNLPVP